MTRGRADVSKTLAANASVETRSCVQQSVVRVTGKGVAVEVATATA
ncbi:MAG: hypothetical protein JWN68_2508 [Nocardioides sp.]|jgi:hypothetical protein|nr:hypothetical protein [Nocardioides sp.]